MSDLEIIHDTWKGLDILVGYEVAKLILAVGIANSDFIDRFCYRSDLTSRRERHLVYIPLLSFAKKRLNRQVRLVK